MMSMAPAMCGVKPFMALKMAVPPSTTPPTPLCGGDAARAGEMPRRCSLGCGAPRARDRGPVRPGTTSPRGASARQLAQTYMRLTLSALAAREVLLVLAMACSVFSHFSGGTLALLKQLRDLKTFCKP